MEDFYDKNENKILGIQENHKKDYRNKVDYFDYAIFDDLRGKAPYLTMDGISEESMPLQVEKLGYVNTGRYGKRSHNGDLVYTKIFEDGVYVDVSQYADEFEKMEDEGFGSWAKFLPENTDGLVGFCRYGTFAEGDVPTSAYNATVHSQAELFEDFYNYCLVSLALTDCSRRMDRGKTKTVVVVTVEFWDDPNDGTTEQFANWQVYTAK